jgi:ketosteroid isomerase-like protein
MTRLLMISVCVLVVGLAGSSLGAQDTSARAAIEAGNKQFAAALARQDAAGVAALYSTNAEAYPPNSNVVRGRADIQKLWKSVMDSGIASADLATTHVESSGDLAYESGTYEMKTKDGKVADHGKYVVVWKRVGGKWMLHRDIWNTNQPAK